MHASELKNDVKNELNKGLERLTMLRDEAKLHIHLASLDARQEWNDTIEPKIEELQHNAHALTDASRGTIVDLVTKVEGFVAKLRAKHS